MGSGASYSIVATVKWYNQGKETYGKKGYDSAVKNVFKDDDILPNSLDGKVVAITGSNQGIGYEAALQCAKLGAFVYLICRSQERATKAADTIKEEAKTDKVDTAILDVGEFAKVRQFATDFSETLKSRNQQLDVLVNNAGAMPSTRVLTSEGNEAIAASTYGGVMLLSALMVPMIPENTGRIIHVASGGAYSTTAKFQDLDCNDTKYDGTLFYAVAKRNMLVLTEKMHEYLNSSSKKKNINVTVMHPGWAETVAVKEAMPDFHKKNAQMFRSPAEGADTITYLAATKKLTMEQSGKFFFDRQQVPMALPWTGTETNAEDQQKVWKAVAAYVGGNMPELGFPDALNKPVKK